MTTIKLLPSKIMFAFGTILVMVGTIATAPHTFFFLHEEECPEALLRDK